MRYPVDNWNDWYDAQGFGVVTSYGFHDGADLNLRTGGNTDLGQPLYAIADGEVTSVHDHPTGFGKHIHIRHDGEWGTVYCHYAHCDTIVVKTGDKVKEGQQVATLGSTGNSKYAHLHWAIKLQPTGIDGIASTKERLQLWTNPIEFVERYLMANELDVCMADRKKFWEERDALLAAIPATDVENAKAVLGGIRGRITELEGKLGTAQANEKIMSDQVSGLTTRLTMTTEERDLAIDHAKQHEFGEQEALKKVADLVTKNSILQNQYDTLKQQQQQGKVTITVGDLFKLLWNQKITIER